MGKPHNAGKKKPVKEKDDIEELDSNMTDAPDPFWPAGVEPTHLSLEKRKDPAIIEAFKPLVGEIWHCEKCGRTDRKSMMDSRFCSECYEKEAQNTALARKVNADWMEQSKELGLAIFERQPEETNNEWMIWEKYRSFYPLKLPTWTELARQTGCSVAVVLKASQKWSYKVRIMAWAQYTDSSVQERRIEAIKEMNNKQLNMAQTMQDKLRDAINLLQPETLKPNEIVNLFRVATELERKITEYMPDKVESAATDTRAKQVATTKPEDLSEVVNILQQAGLLEGRIVGIEQTTRVIAKEDK